MNVYTEGDIIEFSATFKDDAGQPTDPTTVAFKYQVATNSTRTQIGHPTTTLTYSGASQPAVGVVARTSAGTYEAWVDTTGLSGYWTVEWQSTGTAQAVQPDAGLVNPAPL